MLNYVYMVRATKCTATVKTFAILALAQHNAGILEIEVLPHEKHQVSVSTYADPSGRAV
jgi:hypothetical protein